MDVPIGNVVARTGVSASALRFYEERGLIRSTRPGRGRRTYPSDVFRRVAFIRAAQRAGLSLGQIGEVLATLPVDRAPTARQWTRLAASWRPILDERIRLLEALRDDLSACIGCGCLSLGSCRMLNPQDVAGRSGSGPRYLPGFGTAEEATSEARRDAVDAR